MKCERCGDTGFIWDSNCSEGRKRCPHGCPEKTSGREWRRIIDRNKPPKTIKEEWGEMVAKRWGKELASPFETVEALIDILDKREADRSGSNS